MRVAAALAAALAAAAPVAALGHALAPRYDLPLPLWHYLAGAAASVEIGRAHV